MITNCTAVVPTFLPDGTLPLFPGIATPATPPHPRDPRLDLPAELVIACPDCGKALDLIDTELTHYTWSKQQYGGGDDWGDYKVIHEDEINLAWRCRDCETELPEVIQKLLDQESRQTRYRLVRFPADTTFSLDLDHLIMAHGGTPIY